MTGKRLATAAVTYALFACIGAFLLRAVAAVTSADLLASADAELPGWAASVGAVLCNPHVLVITLLGLSSTGWAVSGGAPLFVRSRAGRCGLAAVAGAALIGVYLGLTHSRVMWDDGGWVALLIWGLAVVAWSPAAVLLVDSISPERFGESQPVPGQRNGGERQSREEPRP